MRVLGLTIPGAFSGADAAIFSGLKDRGLLAGVEASRVPARTRLALLLRTFSPSKHRWGRSWRNALVKSESAWVAQTRENERILERRASEYDVVLQVSGLFAPSRKRAPKPVALFCDYTTKLAELNYPDWFGLTPEEAPRWYELELNLYQSADLIFTASHNTARSLSVHYGVPSKKLYVVGEGVTRSDLAPERPDSTKAILFIGIDFPRKGGDVLLAAFEHVRRRVPDATLHIVGPPPRSFTPGVVWHGHVSDRSYLERLFREVAILTLPSICEPFGLALLEGMAHGLPVVGTTVDAMPEIVTDGVNGYLVPPGDSEALADRLVTLLSDPELCAAMGANGRRVVEERFLWDHVIGHIVGHLSALVETAGSTPDRVDTEAITSRDTR